MAKSITEIRFTIEICCTGDNGRSPIIETVGNRVVKDLKLDDKLAFISSGTRAAPKYDCNWSQNRFFKFYGFAEKAGIMALLDIDEERLNNDETYRRQNHEHVRQALLVMRSLEAAYRNLALFERYGQIYDGTRDQTLPRNDVALVLGVTDEHADQIKMIYAAGNYTTDKIFQLNKYAGLEGSIAECLGDFRVAPYRDVIAQAEMIIPKVISRFRCEHGF